MNPSEQPMSQRWGIGYVLSQHQKDFGVGLQLLSPTFLNNTFRVALASNMQWLDVAIEKDKNWYSYNNNKLGLQWRKSIAEHFVVYSEAGLICMIPNTKVDSKSLRFGGYGNFGLEMYILPSLCYFFEMGGIGTGAVANKIPATQIYNNGFNLATGLRFNF